MSSSTSPCMFREPAKMINIRIDMSIEQRPLFSHVTQVDWFYSYRLPRNNNRPLQHIDIVHPMPGTCHWVPNFDRKWLHSNRKYIHSTRYRHRTNGKVQYISNASYLSPRTQLQLTKKWPRQNRKSTGEYLVKTIIPLLVNRTFLARLWHWNCK